MSNGFMVVKEKDWEKADAEQRDWMIFNTLQQMDKRLKKLEDRLWYDKACAVIGGIIGGFGAIVAKWMFWK